MKHSDPYNFPATCHVCGTAFLARYNVGPKAKVCTTKAHSCERSYTPTFTPSGEVTGKGKVISCVEKCCRSLYLAGLNSQSTNEIDRSRILSDEEFQKVMLYTYKLNPPMGLAIRFTGATGCRVSETLLVRRENLLMDWEGHTVKIPSVKREGRPLRTVDISDPILIAELFLLKEDCEKKGRPRGLLFYRESDSGAPEETERPLVKRTLQYNFSLILKKLGIVKDTGIHILRHTRATQLTSAGSNLVYVSRQLGWTSIEMARNYVKTPLKDRQKFEENLPNVGSDNE